MKHIDKIFLLLAALVLCASGAYYVKSMPSVEANEAKDKAKLAEEAEGIQWKNIVVPELKVVSIEWPEIRAQDEEGKWFFQVFTPPQIWIDKNGNFITESPYYKEVARQKFPFAFGEVSNVPYYIEYRGFYGTEKNPTVQLKDVRSDKVIQGKLNSEIIIPATNLTKAVNTGITIKSFASKLVKKPSGALDREITIKLFDKALGREVEIYSFKQTELDDQRRMTLKAADGSVWHIKSKGESIEKGDAKFVVEQIDMNKEFALIKMIPQKDKGDVRVMKVSASGVEQK